MMMMHLKGINEIERELKEEREKEKIATVTDGSVYRVKSLQNDRRIVVKRYHLRKFE